MLSEPTNLGMGVPTISRMLEAGRPVRTSRTRDSVDVLCRAMGNTEGVVAGGDGVPAASSDTSHEPLTINQFSLVLFAFSEATRNLDFQKAELDRLRERALTQGGGVIGLLALLVGLVFEQDAVESSEYWFWMILVTGLAACAVLATTVVLGKVDNWLTLVSPSHIVSKFASIEPTSAAMEKLAGHYDDAVKNNGKILERKRAQYLIVSTIELLLILAAVCAAWRLL